MKFVLAILLLTPLACFTQSVLKGKVSICKECRGVGLTVKDKKTGKDSYIIKTRSRRGLLQTEIMIVPYKLVKDMLIVASGTTNSDGEFEIMNLNSGKYEVQIHINRFLKADTLVQLNGKRLKIEIELDDKEIWRYLDSAQLAKFPYNQKIAKRDIENGDIKILSAGLQVLSGDDLDSLTTRYGFKYFPVAGCLIGAYQLEAMENYNSVVYEYLDRLNGHGWEEKLRSDIVALRISLRGKND